jgi:hypothetical protein
VHSHKLYHLYDERRTSVTVTGKATKNVPYNLLHFAYEIHGFEVVRFSALPMTGHGLGPGGKGNRRRLLSRYFFSVKITKAVMTKMMTADIVREGIQITDNRP